MAEAITLHLFARTASQQIIITFAEPPSGATASLVEKVLSLALRIETVGVIFVSSSGPNRRQVQTA